MSFLALFENRGRGRGPGPAGGGPADELRPAIEAAMRASGRDPHLAWADYEPCSVEAVA
jgi:hypothetical protein